MMDDAEDSDTELTEIEQGEKEEEEMEEELEEQEEENEEEDGDYEEEDGEEESDEDYRPAEKRSKAKSTKKKNTPKQRKRKAAVKPANSDKSKPSAILKVTSKPYQFETTIVLGSRTAEFRVKELISGKIVSTHTKDIPPKEDRCKMTFPAHVVPAGTKMDTLNGDGEPTTPTHIIKTEPGEAGGSPTSTVRVDKLEPMELTVGNFSTEELLEEFQGRRNVQECQCGLLFKDRPLYYLHRPAHDSQDPRKCGHCGEASQEWSEFLSHLYNCKKTDHP